jgi:hypothetical protein
METLPPAPSCQSPTRPPALTPALLGDFLWNTAWEALWQAFFVQIIGGIAVSIASGFCAHMIPSLPPGLAGNTQGAPPALWLNLKSLVLKNQFEVIFAILFAGKTLARLAGYSKNPMHRALAAGLARASRRGANNWFGLIAGNAISAFIAVIVLGIVQEFSWTRFLWGMLTDLLQPVFHFVAGLLPGSDLLKTLGNLFSWYGDNQLKFTFWVIYLAAICDDLGLPNLKTLARWLRRRFFPANAASVRVTADKSERGINS